MNSFESFTSAAAAELTEFCSSETSFIESAREVPATWHPNGFVVFRVSELTIGSLRLHIWPTGERTLRDKTAHVHTHVWDLCSLVLAGEYIESLYFPGEPGGGGAFRSAYIDYVSDPNTLNSAGVTDLVQGPKEVFGPGDFHFVEAGTAHETLIPTGSYAATLLVTSPPRMERAWVHTHEALLPSSSFTRRGVDESLQTDLLDHLQREMGRKQ